MPDDLQSAVDIGREALFITVKLSAPVLIIGFIVGVVINIVQVATQIQEQTITLIPKMLAVAITLFVLMPWLLITLVDYTESVFHEMIFWFQ